MPNRRRSSSSSSGAEQLNLFGEPAEKIEARPARERRVCSGPHLWTYLDQLSFDDTGGYKVKQCSHCGLTERV